jgi:3-hydroxyisobutyrate dehydrogenase-like beta-hydroxyacid dehydrogenase
MLAKPLGFIGVGRMGSLMAGRLLEAGHALSIFDTDEAAMARLEQRGAIRTRSAAEVASVAETVFISLPTPEIVHSVALSPSGIIAGTAVRIMVDLSTTGPAVAKVVAEGLKARRITAVDAPVSGGPSGAEKGTLAVMLACPRELADGLRPLLDVLGRVFFIGESAGMGQTMKLVNNLLSASALAITSEAMVLGAKAGLDPTTMIDVINAGSGRNSATQDKFPRCVLPRRFDFGFATELLYKDVRLCLAEGETLGIPMIVGSAVRQLISIAKATQGPNSDITEIVRSIEQWAGVEVSGAAIETAAVPKSGRRQ